MSGSISREQRRRIISLFGQNPAICLQSLADKEKVTYYAVYKTLNESEIDWRQLKKDSKNRVSERLKARQKKSYIQQEISEDQMNQSNDMASELEQLKGKSDTHVFLAKQIRKGRSEQRTLTQKQAFHSQSDQKPCQRLQSETIQRNNQFKNQFSNPFKQAEKPLTLKEYFKQNNANQELSAVICSDQSEQSHDTSEQIHLDAQNAFKQPNHVSYIQPQQIQQFTRNEKVVKNERQVKLMSQIQNLFDSQQMIENQIQHLENIFENKSMNKVQHENIRLKNHDNLLEDNLTNKNRLNFSQELQNRQLQQVSRSMNQENQKLPQNGGTQVNNKSHAKNQKLQTSFDTSVKEALTIMESLKTSDLNFTHEGGQFMVSGESILNAILKRDTAAEFRSHTLLQTEPIANIHDENLGVKFEEN